jgi:S-formylglutathione hydrolase FrmB
MSPPVHSSTQLILVGLVASAIAARFAWRSRSGIARLFLIIMALCFFVPTGILLAGKNPWLVDARYRTYLKFYWSIRQNMTRAEVIAVMHDFYPPSDGRLAPIMIEDSSASLSFYMNPEDQSEPDTEGISLKMEDGRVTATKYIADRTPQKESAAPARPLLNLR